MSEEQVLLKIKRRYSKDESVSFLLDKLKSARFQIGELQSEIAELKYQHEGAIKELNLKIKQLGEVKTSNGKTKKQWCQDEMFVHMDLEMKIIRKKNQELKKENIRLRDQYFSLLAKTTSKQDSI